MTGKLHLKFLSQHLQGYTTLGCHQCGNGFSSLNMETRGGSEVIISYDNMQAC